MATTYFTVVYDSNGGTSTPSSHKGVVGRTIYVKDGIYKSDTYTYSCILSFNKIPGIVGGTSYEVLHPLDTWTYEFAGWRDLRTGRMYIPTDPITSSAEMTITLTAEWRRTFHSGSIVLPTPETYSENKKTTFCLKNTYGASEIFIDYLWRTQYPFYKWEDESTGITYMSGFQFTPTDDTTFAYIASPATNVINPITFPIPKRDGYTFAGWGRLAVESTGNGHSFTYTAIPNPYTPSEQELNLGNTVTFHAIWVYDPPGIYIDNGEKYELYEPYVDNGTAFEKYEAFVNNGSSWNKS